MEDGLEQGWSFKFGTNYYYYLDPGNDTPLRSLVIGLALCLRPVCIWMRGAKEMGVGVWTTYSAWTGGVKAGASTARQGVHQAWRKPLTYFRIYLFINYSALTQRLYYKPLHFPPILRQGKVSWRNRQNHPTLSFRICAI